MEKHPDTVRLDKLIELIEADQAEVSIGDEIWHGKFLRDQIDQRIDNEGEGELSWERAPEWATYKAQDYDGEWFWFEFKPTLSAEIWACVDGQAEYAGESDDSENYVQSLEERP